MDTPEAPEAKADRPPLPFADFFNAEYRRMVGFAFPLCGSRAAAEAAVRQTFYSAAREWYRLETDDNPEGWVREEVLVRALNYRGAHDAGLDAFTAAAVALPPRQRECIVLEAIEGLNAEQTATALDVPQDRVEARLLAARETMNAAGPPALEQWATIEIPDVDAVVAERRGHHRKRVVLALVAMLIATAVAAFAGTALSDDDEAEAALVDGFWFASVTSVDVDCVAASPTNPGAECYSLGARFGSGTDILDVGPPVSGPDGYSVAVALEPVAVAELAAHDASTVAVVVGGQVLLPPFFVTTVAAQGVTISGPLVVDQANELAASIAAYGGGGDADIDAMAPAVDLGP